MSRIGKPVVTKRTLGLCRAGRTEWKLGVTAETYRVSFGGDERILKLIAVTIAQLCDCTKNHGLVRFKWADFI